MTDRLHIVVIPAWYPTRANPVAGIFIHDQVEAVAKIHTVTVLAPPAPDTPRDVVEGDVRTIRLPSIRARGRAATIARLRALHRMVGVLETEGHRPDLLHAHVFSTGFLAVLCGRRRRLPVVISEHYTDVVEGRLTRWERVIARYAYRHADVVCPVSALLEHSISKLEPRARTQIVPNVVDVDTFARPRIGHTRTDNGGVRIVAVAGLARYKGLGHLIDAFELLLQEQPDASLDIVGEGPDREALEARSIGLPVRFLGQRSREEVADLMARSDVLAVSSLVETFGIAAVEALAAGMRVVATHGCGSADVVAQHGGLVVPVGDSVAMKDALSTLLGRGRRDARHTAEVLRATYGPDAVAAAWDELYRSVA